MFSFCHLKFVHTWHDTHRHNVLHVLIYCLLQFYCDVFFMGKVFLFLFFCVALMSMCFFCLLFYFFPCLTAIYLCGTVFSAITSVKCCCSRVCQTDLFPVLPSCHWWPLRNSLCCIGEEITVTYIMSIYTV